LNLRILAPFSRLIGGTTTDYYIIIRIPEEVESNLTWIKGFLEHDYYSGSGKRQQQLIERMKRYFTKERKVAEKTIERIETLQYAVNVNQTDAGK
jgi:Uri superfamily endonuclease